jgi:pilus assembly protein CpaE
VRSGAREFLQEPIQPQSFKQAIDRYVVEKQRMLENRQEGKIYCFTSGKEGSGVTSIAINIASVYAGMPGNRVALLDLDSPVGDAAIYLNVAPQHKLADIFAAGSRLDPLLLESCMSPADGISLLPAPMEWGRQRALGVEILARLLKVAAQTYTHTIVDLPRFLPTEQMQIVARATELLVVIMNSDLSSISRTGLLLRQLATLDIPDKIRLVINRAHESDEIDVDLMEKALHQPVFFRIPDNHKDSLKAMMSGKPLARNTKSDLAQFYHKLARQLAGIPEPKGRLLSGRSQQPKERRSLLASLFGSGGKASQPRRTQFHARSRSSTADARLRMNLLNR